ncbi:uncharacterized protein LOC103166880 [Ornithorhynchus anatinus]|uniref:uncharacterized protein LOC103166880 n=1 Tax=Ornithorhynchus anatinus TaxID=9258 RepID=UPI0004542F54|nr:uncharacterized protein LOC103166880 [Ornithorhynchus anatinus]
MKNSPPSTWTDGRPRRPPARSELTVSLPPRVSPRPAQLAVPPSPPPSPPSTPPAVSRSSSPLRLGLASLPGSEPDLQRLVRAGTALYDLLKQFASAVNSLVQLVNLYVGTNLLSVALSEQSSLRDFLGRVAAAVTEVRRAVEARDTDMRRSAGLSLYGRLALLVSALLDRSSEAREFLELSRSAFGSVYGPLVVVLLKKVNLPDSVDLAIRQVVASPAMSIHVADLIRLPGPPGEVASPPADPGAKAERQGRPGFLRELCERLVDRTCRNPAGSAADCLEEVNRVLGPPIAVLQKILKVLQTNLALLVMLSDKAQ